MGIHGCQRSFNCIDSYKRTLFILGHKVKVLNIYIYIAILYTNIELFCVIQDIIHL